LPTFLSPLLSSLWIQEVGIASAKRHVDLKRKERDREPRQSRILRTAQLETLAFFG
jgi:hypothetical protein